MAVNSSSLKRVYHNDVDDLSTFLFEQAIDQWLNDFYREKEREIEKKLNRQQDENVFHDDSNLQFYFSGLYRIRSDVFGKNLERGLEGAKKLLREEFSRRDLEIDIDPKESERCLTKALERVASWCEPWAYVAGMIDSLDVPEFKKRISSILDKSLGTESGSVMKQGESSCIKHKDELLDVIYNYCERNYLDFLTVVPERHRTDGLSELFKKEHPYLLDSKELEFFSLAYNLGKKNVSVDIDEEGMAVVNDYVGGKNQHFSSYFTFNKDKPFLLDADELLFVLAVGQIDYKDCTNVYVITAICDGFGDPGTFKETRARSFYSLTDRDQKLVLRGIYEESKHMEKVLKNRNKKNQGPKM